MHESRAQFARRLHVNRSTVTRWEQSGRIVMAGDDVDVEASLARLQQTGGARPDVAERHAAARGAALANPALGGAPASAPAPEGDRIGNSYQAARAVKEKYAALKAKADYETQIGNLLLREDVETAFRAAGAQVRAVLDGLADQLAPLVAPVGDLDECHALISDAARGVLHQLGHQLDRARAELAREAGK